MPHMEDPILARVRDIIRAHATCAATGCPLCIRGDILLRELEAAMDPSVSDEDVLRLHPHAAPPPMMFVDPTGMSASERKS